MDAPNAISCHLMGGLGNQLFQIFTTVACALRQQRKIIFPYSEILTTGKHRPTYWDSFLYPLRSYTTINPSCGSSLDLLYTFPHYSESGFQFAEIPNFKNEKAVMLRGYFQSPKYFEVEKNAVFSFIRLSKCQESIINEYPELLAASSKLTVSMHFRLGDYKLLQHCHPILPYDYYKNAVEYISSNNIGEQIRVIYFCEKEDNADVDIIIQRLCSRFPNIEFEKVDDSIEDWKQLIIMSCCHHNIVANSTFSWWGGYFNNKKGMIICYPELWFGSGVSHNTCDLFPDSWKKISW